jgi:hypothetical protein
MVQVLNDSGADVAQYEVLGIDGPIFAPQDYPDPGDEFSRVPQLIGVAIDDELHAERYVVAQEPILDGKIGLAMVCGITPAVVNIINAADRFAIVEDGEAVLQSSTRGGAKILWKAAGTGLQYAVLQVGAWGDEALVMVTLTRDGGSAIDEQSNITYSYAGIWNPEFTGSLVTPKYGRPFHPDEDDFVIHAATGVGFLLRTPGSMGDVDEELWVLNEAVAHDTCIPPEGGGE